MGMAAVGAVVAIGSAVYQNQQANKSAYDAAVRQNEAIKQQYAADAAKRKGEQDAMAAQNARESAANKEAAGGDEARRQMLANASTTEDASETLLTGSAGVRNAFRRKSTLTGATD
jgi:phosphoenolpyruvate-protein kinase (PTS system EI component)